MSILNKPVRHSVNSSRLGWSALCWRCKARNYRLLRHKGITVRKTIDRLIATFCIENEHELLHTDSDFDGYEAHLGLKVIHP
jgi:hypothetical protein